MQPILHKNVALLRVSDAEALREMELLVSIDEFVIGRVSPTELVVDPTRIKGLLELLESRGLSPLVRRVGE
ncbi:MAG: hypothetical protein EXR69_09645 [Myxococcales bacterium]|nr:hypothetical protein [Myxococcales bacterium]